MDKALRGIYLGIVFIALLCVGCIEDVDSPFNETETSRLLALNGFKSWSLASRSIDGEVTTVSTNCENNISLVFVNGTDEDSLYIVEKIRYCEPHITPDTVFNAKYTLALDTEDNFLDEIELLEATGDNITRMRVEVLFTQSLQISYMLDGQEVLDVYSYLPEHLITTVEANKVLSDYSTKTWSLDARFENEVAVTLETCTDSKNLVFVNSDSDTIHFIEQVSGCEEEIQPITSLTANYVLEGNEFDEFTGAILLGQTSSIGVVSLSTDALRIEYISNGVEIIEDYSY